MKNWILGVLFASFCSITPACKGHKSHNADKKNVITTEDIPGLVQSNFISKYPGATEVFWEDAHEGGTPTFKVKFKRNNKYWKAEFKGDGTFVKEKED